MSQCMAKRHELKTDTKVFQESYDGEKTFEIRKNDRDFQVGDILYLLETQYSGEEMLEENMPLIYTGRRLAGVVTYMMEGPVYGLEDGWCIMSILFGV